MGYLKPQETDLIWLPSDPGHTYWVRFRKRSTWGSERAAQGQMLKLSAKPQTGEKNPKAIAQAGGLDVISEMEWSAYIGEVVFGLITEWNLTDENDEPLELSRENLDKLDPEDGQFLQAEAQKRGGRRTPQADKNFETRSTRRSKATR